MIQQNQTVFSPNEQLQEYLSLRDKLDEIQSRLKQLEQEIISWGVTKYAETKSHVIKSYGDRELILRFRKTYDKNHPDLESVDFDIEQEKKKAAKANGKEIDRLQKQINQLTKQLSLLSQTDEGREFEKEKELIIASLTYEKPELALRKSPLPRREGD